MLDQTFSEKNFLKIISKHEIIKFQLGRNEADYLNKIRKEINTSSSSGILKANFQNIKSITTHSKKQKRVFSCNDLIMHLMLKKTALNVSRLYRINTHSRNEISSQVLRILETASEYNIIKIDIASFYESIPFSKLIKKLEEDKLLSQEAIDFLINLSRELKNNHNMTGLPRGLSISPFLAEIYIRNFDEKMKSMSDIYYFSRYVDDIMIVTFNDIHNVNNIINNNLKLLSLIPNQKSQLLECPTVSGLTANRKKLELTYLGYKYQITNHHFQGKRTIKVLLSDKKVKKIKTRIMHSFLDYKFNQDKDLLLKRIKILAGNYPIYSPMANTMIHSGKLKSGIFYSNPLINQSGLFKEFNIFIKKLIYTNKNNFVAKAIKLLRANHPNIFLELEKNEYNFHEGFKKKVFYDVDISTMRKLKSCWKYKV